MFLNANWYLVSHTELGLTEMPPVKYRQGEATIVRVVLGPGHAGSEINGNELHTRL